MNPQENRNEERRILIEYTPKDLEKRTAELNMYDGNNRLVSSAKFNLDRAIHFLERVREAADSWEEQQEILKKKSEQVVGDWLEQKRLEVEGGFDENCGD